MNDQVNLLLKEKVSHEQLYHVVIY